MKIASWSALKITRNYLATGIREISSKISSIYMYFIFRILYIYELKHFSKNHGKLSMTKASIKFAVHENIKLL